MKSHEVFIHIHQGCFAGTGAIVRLPQCQWSKPGGYGTISQCITTTKHSKAKPVCIFLGIYCISPRRVKIPLPSATPIGPNMTQEWMPGPDPTKALLEINRFRNPTISFRNNMLWTREDVVGCNTSRNHEILFFSWWCHDAMEKNSAALTNKQWNCREIGKPWRSCDFTEIYIAFSYHWCPLYPAGTLWTIR